MRIARRDWIKLAAGSAVGCLFTPVPWKLLDDTAIWSQNWSWIPKLPKGEIAPAFSACTLCPAACGVRARLIDRMPVSIEGVAGHPFSRGVLCPVGIASHQAAFHSRRVRWPLERIAGKDGFSTITRETARSKVLAALAKGNIAILDMHPGRTASALYRRYIAQNGGVYIESPEREEATLDALARLTGREPGTLGIDFNNVRTILSFGAPVLDGWSAPGTIFERWTSEHPFRLIQVEPRASRTALAAHAWLPIRPGAEGALAAEIASALSSGSVSPSAAATGIAPDTILKIARDLSGSGPSVAVGGGDPGSGPFAPNDENAIAALNLLLPAGAIVDRAVVPLPKDLKSSDLAPVTPLAETPDRSISVLVIDASAGAISLPWSLIENKLEHNATVIAFSDRADGLARRADLILPAPAHFEAPRDYGAPPFAGRAAFGIAPALIPEAGGMDPVELVCKENVADWMNRRAAAVYELGRGSIFNPEDGRFSALKDIASAEEFTSKLQAGCCWVDDPPQVPARLEARAPQPARVQDLPERKYSLALLPFGWRAAANGPSATPLLTKLYQESELRESPHRATMNPATAAAQKLADGDTVIIQTRCGSCRRTLSTDDGVMPGVIEAAVGPDDDIIGLCAGPDCTWRLSEATIRRES
jgi:anaerobic selenocysteine-containing dehydrogenase